MVNEGVAKFACAAAVVFFALWFRLYFQATTHWDHPIRADAGQYYSIGWNLVNHGVFSMAHPSDSTPPPDSYRGPGYPLLVALCMQLGGEEHWIGYLLFTQALMGALSAALTIAIARQWLSFSYAIVAGLLVAIWPHTVSLSGLVLTETFFGFMLLLGTYLLGFAIKHQNTYLYVLAGLVFGYSSLINPAILLIPVLIATILACFQRKYAVVFLICALSLPGTWAARGAMLESDRTSTGRLMENVLAGMEPDFDYGDTPTAMDARARVYIGMQVYKHDPLELLDMILSRIRDNPALYAKWYLIGKPMRFWQWSILGNGDIYVYRVIESTFQVQPFYRGIAALCFSLNPWLLYASLGFLPIFAVRIFRHKLPDQQVHLAVVVLLFIYATVLHSVLTPDPRYATPFRPFEILLSVSLLAFVLDYLQAWRQSRPETNN